MLYRKQFYFKQGDSTEHAIMQLTDQINGNFENNCFTLGVFIDLSKASNLIANQILISKLKNYRVKENNLNWFKLSQNLQLVFYIQQQFNCSSKN